MGYPIMSKIALWSQVLCYGPWLIYLYIHPEVFAQFVPFPEAAIRILCLAVGAPIVGCLAGIAAGLTGAPAVASAPPLISATFLHAALALYFQFADIVQLNQVNLTQAVIVHGVMALTCMSGFLHAHIARWNGIMPKNKKKDN